MVKCLIIASKIGKEKILNKSLIDRFIFLNEDIEEYFILIDKYELDEFKENIISKVTYIYNDEIDDIYRYINNDDRLIVVYDKLYFDKKISKEFIEDKINMRYKNLLYVLNFNDVISSSLENIKEIDIKDVKVIYSSKDVYDLKNEFIKKINYSYIEKGVKIIDVEHTYIDEDSNVGYGSVIYPNSFIENSKIGKRCEISGNIKNSIVKDNCKVIDSYLANSVLENNVNLGPYSNIHDNCYINENSYIGSYVEIKKTTIGMNCKIKHQSVLLDCNIGNNVNVGAGVISANYDGKMKHITNIEDNSFIGCNSVLVAPLNIGSRVFVAADTTVIKDIKNDEFSISRIEQKNKINNKKML